MSSKKDVKKEQIIFFRQSALTLKTLGLWQDCDLEMHNKNTMGGFLVIVVGVGLSISAFSEYFNSMAKGDWVGSQKALIFTIGLVLSTSKIYSMWSSVGAIKLCFKWLQEFSRKFKNQRFVRSALIYYRMLFYAGIIIMTLAGLIFLSIPAAESTRVFPFTVTNPVEIVDLLQSPIYQIVYLYQAISVITFGSYITACDTIFCGIMMLIAAFLRSINAFFVETFLDESEHNMSDEEKEKAMITVLEDLMETTRIIKFVGRIFSLVSLSNLLFNIGFIGYASYMSTELPWNSIWFWYMITGSVMQLFQLGFYCFLGEAIVTQTQKLRYNIYQCDWYDHSKSLKLMILLTLQRTQIEPYLTAGNLVPLSNNTFAKILKMASSFCMFLFNTKKSLKSDVE